MEFIEVAKVSEISKGEIKTAEAGGKNMLLANLDGEIYAFDSRCPHVGLSLAKGTLEGNVITCPHHGSRFDVTTGKLIKGPAKKDLPTYKVKIEADAVLVQI